MPGTTVRFENNAIHVQHPTLFAEATGSSCLQFVARAFALPDVQSIEISHRAGSSTIQFADPQTPALALNQLAASMRGPSTAALDDDLASLLSLAGHRQWTRILRTGDAYSVWQMTRQPPDELWLQHEVLARSTHVSQQLCRELAAHPHVERVTTHEPSSSLVVELAERASDDDRVLDELQILRRADQIMRRLGGTELPESLRQDLARTLTNLERGMNLALAGASFGMAVVGVVVPGIPTVPFLLVTSFFLVRSSPRLHDRLMRSRVFGPMIRDWHKHRGMRWQTKAVALGFMVVTICLTLSFVNVPPWLMVIMIVLSGLGAYTMLRIPTVSRGTAVRDDRSWEDASGGAAVAGYN